MSYTTLNLPYFDAASMNSAQRWKLDLPSGIQLSFATQSEAIVAFFKESNMSQIVDEFNKTRLHTRTFFDTQQNIRAGIVIETLRSWIIVNPETGAVTTTLTDEQIAEIGLTPEKFIAGMTSLIKVIESVSLTDSAAIAGFMA